MVVSKKITAAHARKPCALLSQCITEGPVSDKTVSPATIHMTHDDDDDYLLRIKLICHKLILRFLKCSGEALSSLKVQIYTRIMKLDISKKQRKVQTC